MGLASHLHSSFQVKALLDGLERSQPRRPCDEVSVLDNSLGEAGSEASEFLGRPADEGRRMRVRGRHSGVLTGPQAVTARVELACIKVGQLQVGLNIEAWPLGARTCR